MRRRAREEHLGSLGPVLRAEVGDTILVHAGLYKNDRLNYVDPMMTPFDGTMSLTRRR